MKANSFYANYISVYNKIANIEKEAPPISIFDLVTIILSFFLLIFSFRQMGQLVYKHSILNWEFIKWHKTDWVLFQIMSIICAVIFVYNKFRGDNQPHSIYKTVSYVFYFFAMIIAGVQYNVDSSFFEQPSICTVLPKKIQEKLKEEKLKEEKLKVNNKYNNRLYVNNFGKVNYENLNDDFKKHKKIYRKIQNKYNKQLIEGREEN